MTAPTREDEIMEAFMASEDMDNVARYLQVGRRYARLGDNVLDKLWANAWCALHANHQADRWDDCMDAEAELMLRRRPRPEHLIPRSARERIKAHVRAAAQRPDVDQRLREDIERFMRRSARPN
jgi:hypothetical protein